MRLAHVLVLLLSCGCSLETQPLSAGAARSVRGSEPERALTEVSFAVWRRIDWRVDAGAAGDELAADGGRPLRTQVSADAAMPTQSPRLPEHGGADELHTSSQLHEPAADSGRGALDAAPPGAEDGADAGPTAPEPQPSAAGAGGAAGMLQPMAAGSAGSAGAQAGQGGGVAADGGMDAAVVVDAGPKPGPAAPRNRVLQLALQTLERASGSLSPALSALATSVRALLALPGSELTDAVVADVLVRLAGSNACRVDNLSDCTELCAALAQDCSVCRLDSACQSAVERMCALQRGFTCDVRP